METFTVGEPKQRDWEQIKQKIKRRDAKKDNNMKFKDTLNPLALRTLKTMSEYLRSFIL